MKSLTVYHVEENLLALLDTEEMVEDGAVAHYWTDSAVGDHALVIESTGEIAGRVRESENEPPCYVGIVTGGGIVCKSEDLQQVKESMVVALVPKSEDRMAFLNDLAEANEAAVQKRDNCIKFLLHIASQITAIKTETERLAALKKTYENGKTQFSEYLVKIIEEFAPKPKRGNPKLEGTIGVLSIAKKPDVVEIDDPAKLPYSMLDVDVRLNGSAFDSIRQRLGEAGHDDLVDGLTATATYKPRRADVKKAILAGQMIEGADIRFGGNRLAVK